MRLLLDTQVFIWMMTEPAKLSARARAALADAGNERLLSSASVWEMAIKSGIGKLDLDVPLEQFVSTGLSKAQAVELPVRIAHALRVAGLPEHHRDPFDRIIVAQGELESLVVVTADRLISQYDPDVLW